MCVCVHVSFMLKYFRKSLVHITLIFTLISPPPRLLLPYERYSQGQEERPGVEPRPIKAESVEPRPIKAESVEPRPIKAESVEYRPTRAESVESCPIKAEPVESCPIRAEPVSIEGSEDKDSSSRCPKAGPAPNQQPQRDTEPQNSSVSSPQFN